MELSKEVRGSGLVPERVLVKDTIGEVIEASSVIQATTRRGVARSLEGECLVGADGEASRIVLLDPGTFDLEVESPPGYH